MRYPFLMLLFLCTLLLAGCLHFDTRGAVEDGATGAASGFLEGGPIGAILGGVVAAVSGGFAAKKHGQARRSEEQVRRRDKIIQHYRLTSGDIHPDTMAKLQAAT